MRWLNGVSISVVVLLFACGGADTKTEPDVLPADSGPEVIDAGEPDVGTDDVPDTNPTDIKPPPDLPGEDVVAPPKSSYTLTMGDWSISPGMETTRCITKRLSNTEPIVVTRISTELSKGSHHLIVYRTDKASEEPEPSPCTPFIDTLSQTSYPLMLSQIGEETVQFPAGVGLELDAHQMIVMEAHYLNYYPEDVTAQAAVVFHTSPKEEVEHLANMLFYGTIQFDIPAGQTAMSPWVHQDVPNGTKLFALTGHTHQYGTNVEISVSSGLGDEGMSVYPADTPFVWDESPIEYFDPVLEFESGMGLRYRCTWNNTSTHSLQFGPSAQDEMCFLWAYYYPSKGYLMCADGLITSGDCASDG